MVALEGYRRENGAVGVRNHVVVLPVDDLSNAACETVAAQVKGTLPLPHAYGRLQYGEDLDLGWALTNRYARRQRLNVSWRRVRPSHVTGPAKVLDQLRLEDVAGLQKQAAVNRLVGHAHSRIIRELLRQAT